MTDPCCQCGATFNRCSTNECSCFMSGKSCTSTCETSRLAADCLNRAVCRCSCLPTSNTSSKKNSIQLCDVSVTCECRRFGESCTNQCTCKRDCQQNGTAIDLKKELPKGCKCSSSTKKGCLKSSKCPCRQSLQHCGIKCKCQMECCNSMKPSGMHIKLIRQCFLTPDIDNGALVVVIVGVNNYQYCAEFVNCEKNIFHAPELLCKALIDAAQYYQINQLEHIFVYMSKSPCFHQDCEPRCEVLQHCDSQRACAKLMAVTYGQLRRQLANVNLQMTVKFLSPYVKKGDLYTQQGILHLMQAGICVQPLVLKEWNEVMLELIAADPKAPPLSPLALWSEHCMDRYVRQAQQYVNACRRTLGLRDMYWTSAFHDLLKTAAITCDLTQNRLDDIATKLSQLDKMDMSQTELTRSTRDLRIASNWNLANQSDPITDWMSAPVVGVLTDELYITKTSGNPRPPQNNSSYSKILAHKRGRSSSYKVTKSRSATPARSQSMYSDGNEWDQSLDTTIDEDMSQTTWIHNTTTGLEEDCQPGDEPSGDPKRQSYAENPTFDHHIEQSSGTDDTVVNANCDNRKTTLAKRDVTKMILQFSGRSISEQERKEISKQMNSAINRLRLQVNQLMLFLEQKSGATPV